MPILLTNYDGIDFFYCPFIIRYLGLSVDPATLKPRATHSQTKARTEEQKKYGVVIDDTETERTHPWLKASSIYYYTM